MRSVHINEIGVVEHSAADELMRVMQSKRIEDEIEDTILVCEHPEVVTVGPRARNDGITPPPGYSTSPVDRGGGLTWHGPGQIVIYPIIKWDLEGEANVKAVISILESWVISAFKELGLEGRRDDRMQGVWIGDNKVCSIGLSFLRWTSRHGLTINLDTPPGRVEMVSGCGLGAETTTSIRALGHEITRNEMLTALWNNFASLGRDISRN